MAEGKKIGSGHAEAMMRSGLKELAQVLPAFPNHSVQPVEEIGLAGNATQAEVNEQKGTFKDRLESLRAASPSQGQEKQETQQAEPER